MNKSHSAACAQQQPQQLLKRWCLLSLLFSSFLFFSFSFCVCVCSFVYCFNCMCLRFSFTLVPQSVERIIQNNEPLYAYFITNIHSHTHRNPFISNLLASNTHTHTLYTCRFRYINSYQLMGCCSESLIYRKITFAFVCVHTKENAKNTLRQKLERNLKHRSKNCESKEKRASNREKSRYPKPDSHSIVDKRWNMQIGCI